MNNVNIMGSSVSIRALHAAILQPPNAHFSAPDNAQTSQHDEQHDAKQTTSNNPNVT